MSDDLSELLLDCLGSPYSEYSMQEYEPWTASNSIIHESLLTENDEGKSTDYADVKEATTESGKTRILSEDQLWDDIEHAIAVLDRDKNDLQTLTENEIFSASPKLKPTDIHFQSNKKVQKLFDMCQPNLAAIVTNSRYKYSMQNAINQKKMLHFYYNALVNWVKLKVFESEPEGYWSILGNMHSMYVRPLSAEINPVPCNFVDRMILTIAYAWKHLTSSITERANVYSASMEEDTQSEMSSASGFTNVSVDGTRSAVIGSVASLQDIEGLRRSDIKLANNIEQLTQEMSALKCGLDEVKQNIGEIAGNREDIARKKSRGQPVATAAPAPIPEGEEVLNILRQSTSPINALQVRDKWFMQIGLSKDTAPPDMLCAKAYNRVLNQLLREGRIIQHSVTSGKPLWSAAN